MELKGKRVLVAGLGESGLAMAKWLAREGADLVVADSRAAPPNADALRAAIPGVELRAADFSDATAFDGVELIAVSPGIPVGFQAIAPIASARARGVPIVSEIELFAWGRRRYAPSSRVIAITGSNGKTTTTALSAHLLVSAGVPARACGNISPSALDALMNALDEKRPSTFPRVWVIELSSFQLETTQTLNADAGAILNITEDHLDRYDGMAAYAAAKERVFLGSASQILNRGDARCAAIARECPSAITFGLDAPTRDADYGIRSGKIVRGEEELIALDELSITGLHNAANAMAALALCNAIGVENRQVLPGLSNFTGLPHRVEWICEVGGVSYYDDSKGTNVGATLAAIEGLGKKMAVILGGEGKGQDFSPLRDALALHARAVALIGRDAGIIDAAIQGCGVPVKYCADLEAAVSWCATQTRPGDAVLLSPACASFDMFRNYAHRSEVFVSAARKLLEAV
ncbi:MAG: UDP-N-acetylmuramoyl-L-alanine--D-glutamate ligase [Candidatus Accumulibacter sp.]|nr:UDP-N-acetylmuramoyl-L-alanine--D-glutamate ligase [Accumulibacter sp.]